MTTIPFSAWIDTLPDADQKVAVYDLYADTTFEAGAPDAQLYAYTAPADGDWTIDIQIDGNSIATGTILQGENTGTWTQGAAATGNAASLLSMVAPGVQDSALAGLVVTFPGVE